MAHKPGSFTKNFGWETADQSLARLHAAIRAGFAGSLQRVERETWRAQAQLPDRDRELIALNFFLHNHAADGINYVSVDELVRQAVVEPHARAFDHLALFALNLSEAGYRTGHNTGEQKPILWANEYIREVVWENGGWRAERFNRKTASEELSNRIDGQPQSVQKCISNYRRILTLCGHNIDAAGLLNTDADTIGPAACYLTWDRLSLDGTSDLTTVVGLVDVLQARQVHRLLGVDDEWFDEVARRSAHDYLEIGGVGRLDPNVLDATPVESPIDEVSLSNIIAQMQTDAAVDRRVRQVQQQIRDRKLADILKAAYDNRCMFCGVALTVGIGPEQLYAEAAHIRPLGTPHDGPDVVANMLVLCPNHHLQFDRGVLRLELRDNVYHLVSKVHGDDLNGRQVELREDHVLEPEFVKYHYDWHGNE